MFASIITNLGGLIILAINVWTQNNENISILIRREDYLNLEEEYSKQKKIYEFDQISFLYEQQLSFIGMNSKNKFEQEKYYEVFQDNVMMINRLYNLYDNCMFSINAYTHLKFDEFTDWYTGFNSTGLTDEDVILFNRSIRQDLPSVMDWSGDILHNYVQDTKCKNSYVLSALSKLFKKN